MTNTSDKSRGRRRIAILAAVVLLAAAAGVAIWMRTRPASDPGATLMSADGMSREEVQEMLDAEVAENMMDVSIAATPELSDGQLAVNVINPENNRFAQRFAVEQDGEVLYESGSIEPGEGVETCEVGDAAHAGEATVTIWALNEDGGDHGNPTAFNVEIVE